MSNEMIVRLRNLERQVAELMRHEWVGPTRGCRVYRSTQQSIPNNAWTPIAFDAEIFDKGDCWAIAQPTRLVAPRDGYYNVEANVGFVNAGDTDGQRMIGIFSSGGNYLRVKSRIAAGAAEHWMYLGTPSGMIYLVAGDYVTVGVYQNSGAAMNIEAASQQMEANCGASFTRMH